MALSATTAWEVRTTGSDTANSGGFRYGALLSAPSAPTVNGSASGGTVAANTYYCVVTYTDISGETVISGQTSVTVAGATSSITVTSPAAVTGAQSWSCYFGTTSGGPYFPQGTALTIGNNRVVTTTPPTSGTQPRGTDYSVQDAAQVSVSNAVTNGTTTVTSATAGFTGAHVGNVVKIVSSYYDIVSVTNSTTIVVDRTITSGSGQALIIGGGFATPGAATGVASTAGHDVFIKAGTYSIANGTVNTAGNWFQTNANLIGYNTNRYAGNTDASLPTLNPTANSMVILWLLAASQRCENISLTNTGGQTTVTGITANAAAQQIRRCSFDSLATPLSNNSTGISVIGCVFNACGGISGGNNNNFQGCVLKSNTGNGISCGTGGYVGHCIVANSGNSTNSIIVGANSTVENCSIYGQGTNSTGLTLNGDGALGRNVVVWGSNASGSIGYETVAGTTRKVRLYNCAVGNCATNVSTRYTNFGLTGQITLTADPFTNAAGNDFSLNNTAGGGAALRGVGWPTSFDGLSTNNYSDIGAAQVSSAGTGLAHRVTPGGGLVR